MSEGPTIRNVHPDDLAKLNAIETLCFGERSRFPTETLAELIVASNVSGLIAEKDDAMLGFIFFTTHPALIKSTVLTIDIHPDHRRKGIGRMLMDKMINIVTGLNKRTVSLQVDIANEKALELYSSLGFLKIGVIKDYYGKGRDALDMEMELPSK